ncbi:unnamed protein product [Phaeothamnion confervicola]
MSSEQMRALLAAKAELEDNLLAVESEIYDLEEQYILETPNGNIIKGWDGILDNRQPPVVRRRVEPLSKERIFSHSSHSFWADMRQRVRNQQQRELQLQQEHQQQLQQHHIILQQQQQREREPPPQQQLLQQQHALLLRQQQQQQLLQQQAAAVQPTMEGYAAGLYDTDGDGSPYQPQVTRSSLRSKIASCTGPPVRWWCIDFAAIDGIEIFLIPFLLSATAICRCAAITSQFRTRRWRNREAPSGHQRPSR